MWGLLAPCCIPYAETFVYGPSTWLGQTACQISASYLHASCSYANMYLTQAYHYTYVPKNAVFFGGGLRVQMWKCCVLTPKRHYPAWIRVCWRIACQNRFNGLRSRFVKRLCVQRNEKNRRGERNPWVDVDQMWHVGRYDGRNHVCNTWWVSVKGCGCSERGNFAFSHWLEVSPLQH